MPPKGLGPRMHYATLMASLRPIRIRTDGRTRHLVDLGVRLAADEGTRIGEHFMRSYGVPPEIVRRVLPAPPLDPSCR